MIWQKEPLDPSLVKQTAERYSLDMLSASILSRRGILSPAELLFFLEKDLLLTHNPFLFSQMDTAVDRIRAAAEEEEKILVFGDKDVDGITATVIMMTALRHMGLNPEFRIPVGDDLYGLSRDIIDEFAEADGTLIITVDTGISSLDEISYATTLGIDTLVFDHHVVQDGRMPGAVAVVNPKDPASGYPFSGLAGCGVAFKLFQALCTSRTELFNQPLCFLHIEQTGEASWRFEAARTANLVVLEKMILETGGPLDQAGMDRFTALSEGCALFAWDGERQTSLLTSLTGGRVHFELQDIRGGLAQMNRAFEGKTLHDLSRVSRISRYTDEIPDHLGVLLNLFRNFYYRRYEEVFAPCFHQLDLVALGTLADLMPLVNENRILIRQGLAVVNRAERPALRELFLKLQLLGSPLGAHEISWQVSPVLNSAGRMGRSRKAIELFLTEDADERKKLVADLLSLNQERRKLGDDLWNELRPQADVSLEHLGGRMIALISPRIPRGITGILASRFSSLHNVPVMILSERKDCISGSLRSPKEISVQRFLDESASFFDDFGGHDCAAGFSMPHNKLKPFMAGLPKAARQMFKRGREDDSLILDAELPLPWMNSDLEKLLSRFEPYGQGFGPLVFLSRGLRVADVGLVGRSEKKHARFQLDSGNKSWTAFFWNEGERACREVKIGSIIDVVFKLSRNTYMGNTTLQLHLLDYKVVSS